MSRIVVITGASTGLGLELSERFVLEGDMVYGATLTRRHWSSARKSIVPPERFNLSQVDVCSEAQVRRFLSKVYQKTDRLDILINNAGYANRPTPLEKLDTKEFEKHFTANLLSVFLMCKYALPLFQKQRSGLIINIASYAGKRAVPSLAAYSASKFGVVALGQAIAKENSDSGFRCITVCPGGMNTKMRERLFGKEDAERQQSAGFVAEQIMKIITGEIEVASGSDVVVRHRQVSTVNLLPAV